MGHSKLLLIIVLQSLAFSIAFTSTKQDENFPTSIEPTQTGCFLHPWVCHDRPFFLLPRLCCRDVCADVRSDVNNCGFCRIQCPPMWGCCNAHCRNLLLNPKHCGACFNVCPLGQLCIAGVCVQLASNIATAAADPVAVAPVTADNCGA